MGCGTFWFCVCKTSVHHYCLNPSNNNGIVWKKDKATEIGFGFPKEIGLTGLDQLGISGKLSVVLSFPTLVSG